MLPVHAMAIDFEDEFMEDAEFAALDAALRAAEAAQSAAVATGVFSVTESHQWNGEAAPQPAAGAAAAVQPAPSQGDRQAPQGLETREEQHPAGVAAQQAAPVQAASTQPQQPGATPAMWGGARPSGAALRGIAVPSASLRSGQSGDRRLSGASVSSQHRADGDQEAKPIASPEQLAAEMAAEQALAKAQRDDIPHLILQVWLCAARWLESPICLYIVQAGALSVDDSSAAASAEILW